MMKFYLKAVHTYLTTCEFCISVEEWPSTTETDVTQLSVQKDQNDTVFPTLPKFDKIFFIHATLHIKLECYIQFFMESRLEFALKPCDEFKAGWRRLEPPFMEVALDLTCPNLFHTNRC